MRYWNRYRKTVGTEATEPKPGLNLKTRTIPTLPETPLPRSTSSLLTTLPYCTQVKLYSYFYSKIDQFAKRMPLLNCNVFDSDIQLLVDKLPMKIFKRSPLFCLKSHNSNKFVLHVQSFFGHIRKLKRLFESRWSIEQMCRRYNKCQNFFLWISVHYLGQWAAYSSSYP